MNGSRPLVGSSSRVELGMAARAATSATFCRFPFEWTGPSSWGRARTARAARRGASGRARPWSLGEEIDDLAAGEARPQRDVARYVRQPGVQRLGTSCHGSQAETGRGPVRAHSAEEDAQGRRLAGAVGPGETVHLALLDPQVEAVERGHRPEVLHRTGHLDDGGHGTTVRRSVDHGTGPGEPRPTRYGARSSCPRAVVRPRGPPPATGRPTRAVAMS